MDIITSVRKLMNEVIHEEENREILQTDLKPMENLLLDITTLFQEQREEAREAIKIWMQLLHNSFIQARSLPQRPEHRCLDWFMCNPGRLLKEIQEWKVLFDCFFHGLQEDFSIFVSAHQIVQGDLMQLTKTRKPIARQPLSTDEIEESVPPVSKDEAEESADEAWKLFKGTAFQDNCVPTDIEQYGRSIADECKGFPLATRVVAAAMKGKTRVDEWKTALSSIKNAHAAFPDTLHPQLYQLLRWGYDALPNPDVKNCFLYCVMYPRDDDIYVQDLVQMWIAEGFVRSKQGNSLMDMAIGHSYVNLLVARCLFQNVAEAEKLEGVWNIPQRKRMRVDHAIREMALYVGEEENCLYRAGQGLQNFPTILNEDCKRISVRKNDIKNLPIEFRCPKLVSLILSHSIEEVPSGFLVNLTSLKVLHLPGSRIDSIPSSVGQLKQLGFLSLQRVRNMVNLPEEICHLTSLQFLDLQDCKNLQSLPSKIGDLKNLKYLSVRRCHRLEVIPYEISQLTSLSTLDAYAVRLSVEAESEASIWRLKGLRSLRMLRIAVRKGITSSGKKVKKRTTSSGMKVGIMGTWLDMRHLWLDFGYRDADLPDDMKDMRKLQSFDLWEYQGSSLPDYTCKFQHLENLSLNNCNSLWELSVLGRLPMLKCLALYNCGGLKELGIGNSGGFLMLEKLVLKWLGNLKSISAAADNREWNRSTLPSLSILKVSRCAKLRRLPVGMHRLLNLSTIYGEKQWWEQIIWEDDDDARKIHLEKLFKDWIWPGRPR